LLSIVTLPSLSTMFGLWLPDDPTLTTGTMAPFGIRARTPKTTVVSNDAEARQNAMAWLRVRDRHLARNPRECCQQKSCLAAAHRLHFSPFGFTNWQVLKRMPLICKPFPIRNVGKTSLSSGRTSRVQILACLCLLLRIRNDDLSYGVLSLR